MGQNTGFSKIFEAIMRKKLPTEIPITAHSHALMKPAL